MEIIKAEKRHCGEILRILKILEAEHNVSGMVIFTSQSLCDALFGERPGFEAYVAEDSGKLVGLCMFFERPSTWKGPNIHIEDIIVLPEYRGQKIGEQLMEKVVEDAKCRGFNRVELDVDGTNERAIRFYKSNGFDCSWLTAKKYL